MSLTFALPIALASIVLVDMAVSGGQPAKTKAGAIFWLAVAASAAAFLFWSFFIR